jgi:hypothetical protein
MHRRWKITALALVGALALLAVVSGYFGREDDPFTAKYRQLQEGTTIEEAARLLGPPFDEEHPGMSMGDHTYYWKSEHGAQTIDATWDLTGQLFEKRLVAKDGTVILSDRWSPPWSSGSASWWERFLSGVGLR